MNLANVRNWPILLKKSPLKVCEILYVHRCERFMGPRGTSCCAANAICDG